MLMLVLVLVYIFAAVALSAYGFNALLMTLLYLRHRGHGTPTPTLARFPHVTVQLPVFNERYVIERLIDAVARLDYPRHQLEIQILDDSTDVTTELARRRAAYHRAQGLDVQVIRRPDRQGFKAGALRHGLRMARGELIAIFDADFIPTPDFLRRTVPYFLADERLGMVQTRWGHINDDYSELTRAQALGIDGHFVVEQTARNRTGLFMNFNGTAGVWRRECIEDAGGWHDDTLTEDLDLSYRAQLAGWRFLYLPDVVTPAELPPQLQAFKNQQARWARGSVQCLRKLAQPVLRSSVPVPVKLQALLHMGGYLAHPLLLILLLVTLPMIRVRASYLAPLAYLSVATLGPPLLFSVSQWATYPGWRRRLGRLPWLMLLGAGIAISNSVAVGQALLGSPGLFRRTPKFRIESREDGWTGNPYALSFSPMALAELALAAYALAGAVLAGATGHVFIVPYLLLYACGFGYVGMLGLVQSLEQAGVPTLRPLSGLALLTLVWRILRHLVKEINL